MVQFTELEGIEMAQVMKMSTEDFFEQYTFPSADPGIWELREVKVSQGYDCVLLGRCEDTGKTWCTAHKARPAQCRTWPFWPDNLRNEKSWNYAGKACEGINRGDFIPLKVIQREMSNTPEWSRTR